MCAILQLVLFNQHLQLFSYLHRHFPTFFPTFFNISNVGKAAKTFSNAQYDILFFGGDVGK